MNDLERIDDPEESLRAAQDGQQARIWTSLPGIVKKVDLVKQTVSVQLAIQGCTIYPDGTKTWAPYPLLEDVAIEWPRAGGFVITFPIKVDDECRVEFAARCIDSWWQNGGVQIPAEIRMHDLSDGIATFAPTSQPKCIKNVSDKNMQIRSEDGKTFIELTPDGGVNIKSTAATTFSAPVVKAYDTPVAVDGDVTTAQADWATWLQAVATAAKYAQPIPTTPISKINTAVK